MSPEAREPYRFPPLSGWQTVDDLQRGYPAAPAARWAEEVILFKDPSTDADAASADGTEAGPRPTLADGTEQPDAAFREWLRAVDGCLVDLTGHTTDFVPDDPERFPWRQWFRDGLSPEACAEAVTSAQAGDWAERYRIDKDRD